MPAISFEAGGGTAGFAQLGVVVGLLREGQGRSQDTGFWCRVGDEKHCPMYGTGVTVGLG